MKELWDYLSSLGTHPALPFHSSIICSSCVAQYSKTATSLSTLSQRRNSVSRRLTGYERSTAKNPLPRYIPICVSRIFPTYILRNPTSSFILSFLNDGPSLLPSGQLVYRARRWSIIAKRTRSTSKKTISTQNAARRVWECEEKKDFCHLIPPSPEPRPTTYSMSHLIHMYPEPERTACAWNKGRSHGLTAYLDWNCCTVLGWKWSVFKYWGFHALGELGAMMIAHFLCWNRYSLWT